MRLRGRAVDSQGASCLGTLGGLLSGNGGFLRPSVQVQSGADYWKIEYSLWELNVPTSVVDAEPDFRAFLEGARPVHKLRVREASTLGLIQLMLSQGCATCDSTRTEYALPDVRFIVGSLFANWYRIYYSHPFWEKLRTCQLSIEAVFAWALRTYHLSRSAGPTAARGAIHSRDSRARETFLKSALEEYSHCEIYYFPKHAVFGLEDWWIRELVPLPSSTAFDQQMAIIAEDDWLAHAIVALFQEYTAVFKSDAFRLYDQLEKHYGLSGFFNGWRQHIGYDVSQTHADEFEALFATRQTISRSDMLRSIHAASVTIGYLIAALDELSAVPASLRLRAYRTSPRLFLCGATQTTILDGLTNVEAFCRQQRFTELYSVLVERTVPKLRHNSSAMVDLLSDVLTAKRLEVLVTKALSIAADHVTVLLCGTLLELVAVEPIGCDITNVRLSPSLCAVSNFLRESAARPRDLVFLISICVETLSGLASDRHPLPTFLAEIAESIEERIGLEVVSESDATRLATLGLQFVELCDAATKLWRNTLPMDALATT